MDFKAPSIALQFTKLHPELRRALGELDVKVREWGLPEIVLTEAVRTPGEQEDIYWGRYLGPLVTEEEARLRARNRWSWHCFGAAADVRSDSYDPKDRERVWAWLKNRCPKPGWELLYHDVGSGFHWHLGRRDWLWARDWQQKHKGAV